MEKGNKLFRESRGRDITVYYNDTSNSVSYKTGKLIDFDEFAVKLLEAGADEAILIPRGKCIRIEVKGREKCETAAK